MTQEIARQYPFQVGKVEQRNVQLDHHKQVLGSLGQHFIIKCILKSRNVYDIYNFNYPINARAFFFVCFSRSVQSFYLAI